MWSSVTSIARRIVPSAVVVRRERRHQEQLREFWGVPQLAGRFTKRHGTEVRRGPIRGLRYPAELLERIDMPVTKLLGAYEEELHEVLGQALEAKPRVIVDVGAADGFYAVGLARSNPDLVVHAFELEPTARRQCVALAAANHVTDRVHVHGRFRSASFASLDLDRALVLSDCEGAELEFFSQQNAPRLRRATMLIEIHDASGTRIRDTIYGAFCGSHDIRTITSVPRDLDRYPELATFSLEERRLALSENRPHPMSWLFLQPNECGPVTRRDELR